MCFIVAYCVVEFILIMYISCLFTVFNTCISLVYFCVQILMNTNIIYLSADTCCVLNIMLLYVHMSINNVYN